ncbi:MAG: RHS repeat protein [Deltaproteobacteria bacterium]|nr:RHS repeat protein [Deltaproteobacteria bacterium]
MKTLWLWLVVLMISAYGALTSSVGAAQSSEPTLSFDRKGRLIQVVTPDGRRCTYRYAPDGRLTSPLDPSCGEPQEWLKGKRG